MGYNEITETAEFLRKAIAPVPNIAVVLGSGLGDFAAGLGENRVLPHGDSQLARLERHRPCGSGGRWQRWWAAHYRAGGALAFL